MFKLKENKIIIDFYLGSAVHDFFYWDSFSSGEEAKKPYLCESIWAGWGGGGGSLRCFSRAKDFHIYLLLPLKKLPTPICITFKKYYHLR